MKNKKILVLSVSSWNSKVGSDTWATLLEQYDANDIANISLREEIPDSKACGHYFVISENRIIKSLLNRKIKTGYSVSAAMNKEEHLKDLAEHNERYKKMNEKRSYLKLIAREIIWKIGHWKTKELNTFIDNFKPDIILYFMDGYIHFNRLCRYAKKRTGAKSIGFFVDDNFTYKQSKGVGFKFYRFFQRRSLKKVVKNTDAFWAITETTKEEVDSNFNINCTVVTKPLRQIPKFEKKSFNYPIQILYTGNLQIGRDRSLVKVIDALKEINKNKVFFEVNVYTKTVLSEFIKDQIECEFCHIHASISQSEVFALQSSADILLFLEDVDGQYATTARLSFSTKITDYLSSGKCIFAVGCLDTAPMKYFLNNDSAIVATEAEEMIKKFNEIIENNEIIGEYAKRSCDCGIRNHNKNVILNIVNKSINETLNIK